MTVTLGMIVRNEERFLGLCLPVVRKCFEELVAIDAESTDRTRDILAGHGARIFVRPWTNDYSAARNEAIRQASGDWMFMLDADEAMFPRDIQAVRRLMSGCTCIRLPRIEFVLDDRHVDPSVYPDWQSRCFKLNTGCHYVNKVHEGLCVAEGKTVHAHGHHIYHYGQCRPPADTWLRHHNYGLMRKGLPTLKEIPKGLVILPRTNIRLFEGDHPLKGRLS